MVRSVVGSCMCSKLHLANPDSYLRVLPDRIRAIFNEFPRVSNVPQEKVDIAADSKTTDKTITAKTHVEGCMAFLKAALK
jgi:hypothetical protein